MTSTGGGARSIPRWRRRAQPPPPPPAAPGVAAAAAAAAQGRRAPPPLTAPLPPAPPRPSPAPPPSRPLPHPPPPSADVGARARDAPTRGQNGVRSGAEPGRAEPSGSVPSRAEPGRAAGMGPLLALAGCLLALLAAPAARALEGECGALRGFAGLGAVRFASTRPPGAAQRFRCGALRCGAVRGGGRRAGGARSGAAPGPGLTRSRSGTVLQSRRSSGAVTKQSAAGPLPASGEPAEPHSCGGGGGSVPIFSPFPPSVPGNFAPQRCGAVRCGAVRAAPGPVPRSALRGRPASRYSNAAHVAARSASIRAAGSEPLCGAALKRGGALCVALRCVPSGAIRAEGDVGGMGGRGGCFPCAQPLRPTELLLWRRAGGLRSPSPPRASRCPNPIPRLFGGGGGVGAQLAAAPAALTPVGSLARG